MSARELLKIYGMQVTMPRIFVIEDLMNNRFHATADEIFRRVNKRDESVSRATVYNVLNALLENKAVRALTIDDKQMHYDIDLTPHAHFRCTHCGRILIWQCRLLARCICRRDVPWIMRNCTIWDFALTVQKATHI